MSAEPRRRNVTLSFDGLTADEFYDMLPRLLRMIEDAAEVEGDEQVKRLNHLGSFGAAYETRWTR